MERLARLRLELWRVEGRTSGTLTLAIDEKLSEFCFLRKLSPLTESPTAD